MEEYKLETRLKKLREEKKLTIAAFAEEIKHDNTTISKVESGNRQPSVALLRKYSKYFGVSVDYLLGLEDYHGIICKEAYYVGKSLKDFKDGIVNKFVEDEEIRNKNVDDYIENQHKLGMPTDEEFRNLENWLSIDKFKDSHDIKDGIKCIIYLIKAFYKENENIFEENNIKLIEEDYNLIQSELEMVLLEKNKYFKNTLRLLLENIVELNSITKLVISLRPVERNYLQNFLIEIMKNR